MVVVVYTVISNFHLYHNNALFATAFKHTLAHPSPRFGACGGTNAHVYARMLKKCGQKLVSEGRNATS